MSLTEEEKLLLDKCVKDPVFINQHRTLEYRKGIYNFDKKGFVNVNGHVDLDDQGLTKIPIKFGKIDGSFSCNNNYLTSLENGPYEVTQNYSCQGNYLTTLPKIKIDRKFYFSNNPPLTEFFDKIPLKKLHKDYNEFYICQHFPKTILRYKEILTTQEILKLLDMYPDTKLYL
jgi:hypothetical protein